MALLDWKADYRTGQLRIDDDHRELFDRINDFHHAWLHDRDRREIARLLERLIQGTEEHFAREEEIMRACGYPGLQAHTAAHEALLAQIFVLQEHFTEGRIGIDEDAVEFLRGWLAEHILAADLKFARHLDGEPAEQPPRKAAGIDVV